MSAITGKWCLKEGEGLMAYYDAIGSPQQHRDMMRGIAEKAKADSKNYIEELTVDKANSTLRRVIFIDGEKKRDSGEIKIGSEIDGKAGDGRSAKIKMAIVSETKMTRQETGDGFTSTATLEVCGNDLCVTMTGNGATAKFKYQRA